MQAGGQEDGVLWRLSVAQKGTAMSGGDSDSRLGWGWLGKVRTAVRFKRNLSSGSKVDSLSKSAHPGIYKPFRRTTLCLILPVPCPGRTSELPGGLVVPECSRVWISVYGGFGDTPICSLQHMVLLSKMTESNQSLRGFCIFKFKQDTKKIV